VQKSGIVFSNLIVVRLDISFVQKGQLLKADRRIAVGSKYIQLMLGRPWLDPSTSFELSGRG